MKPDAKALTSHWPQSWSCGYLLLTLQKDQHCFNKKTWWRIKSGKMGPGCRRRESTRTCAGRAWNLCNHSLSQGGLKQLVLCAWGSLVSLWFLVVPEGLSACHGRRVGLEAQNQVDFLPEMTEFVLQKALGLSSSVSLQVPLLQPSHYSRSQGNLTRPALPL